jgi:hypothetical protein
MTVYVADEHAHVHRLVSVVKMATVLEEQCSVLRFLRVKGHCAKDTRKEMFPIYGGKCSLHKAVHNRV